MDETKSMQSHYKETKWSPAKIRNPGPPSPFLPGRVLGWPVPSQVYVKRLETVVPLS